MENKEMTIAEMKELMQGILISQKETEAVFEKSRAEWEAELKELKAVVKQTNKQLGELGNRLGEFVENMVQPALLDLFQARGLDVHEALNNYRFKEGKRFFEIDSLLINAGEAVAVECKLKPDTKDVDNHIIRIEQLSRVSNSVKGKRLMGAIAGAVMGDDLIAYAVEKGLYVLVPSGDTVVIQNEKEFEPRVW